LQKYKDSISLIKSDGTNGIDLVIEGFPDILKVKIASFKRFFQGFSSISIQKEWENAAMFLCYVIREKRAEHELTLFSHL